MDNRHTRKERINDEFHAELNYLLKHEQAIFLVCVPAHRILRQSCTAPCISELTSLRSRCSVALNQRPCFPNRPRSKPVLMPKYELTISIPRKGGQQGTVRDFHYHPPIFDCTTLV